MSKQPYGWIHYHYEQRLSTCLIFGAQEQGLGLILSDWQKKTMKDTPSYPSKTLGLHDHELTFICIYIHVCSVYLSSRGTVRPLQKKARLLKRIHISWGLSSFFGPCNIRHVQVIKVLVRSTSIDQYLIGYFMVMDGSRSIN
jgi:hypothetical protein